MSSAAFRFYSARPHTKKEDSNSQNDELKASET